MTYPSDLTDSGWALIERHIVTDTQAHLWHVKVHAANTYNTVAGCGVFEEKVTKYPDLKGVCADAGYRKTFEGFVKTVLKKTVDSSARIAPGWAFSWLNHYRRLSKDYEIAIKSAENTIMIAHSMILIKRLA